MEIIYVQDTTNPRKKPFKVTEEFLKRSGNGHFKQVGSEEKLVIPTPQKKRVEEVVAVNSINLNQPVKNIIPGLSNLDKSGLRNILDREKSGDNRKSLVNALNKLL